MEEYFLDKFKPNIYLHSDETIQPMSFDDYIKKSELLINGINILKKGDVKLPLQEHINKENYKCLNFIGESKFPNQNDINNIPLYGKVNILNDKYIDIIYMLFFPINTGYNICCNIIGYHSADLECIILRINKRFELIENIYLSAHGEIECQNYNYKNISYEKNSIRITPIIYCALGSHALYPKPKTYIRIGGFANDKTNKGILWKTNNIINLNNRQDILSFKGNLGIDTNKEPSVSDFNRDYLIKENNFKKKNISFFQRFFLCCYK